MQLHQLISDVMKNPPALFYSNGDKHQDTKKVYLRVRNAILKLHNKAQPVGIRLPKNPEYFLSILACMELGIPYVPLKEDFPENRIREITEDANIGFCIDQKFLDDLAEENQVATTVAHSKLSDDMPLYIIFTSGSTGRPKGVVISRAAFGAYLNWLNQYFPEINSQDRLLQVTEFTFDISLIDIVLYLTKKPSIYFTDFGGAIFKMAQEISKYKITTINTVPNNINMLLTDFIASKSDFSSLRWVMIGGARLSYGLYKKVCKYFSDKVVSNFYGPTEFTIYSHSKKISFNEYEDCKDGNVSIGFPNTAVHAEIFSNGGFCKVGESGELLLSGKQIMNEYINNPEKTAEAIIKVNGVSYYKTGDLSYKNDSNEFFITGRLDDTIKYRGFRINLLDIDSYIAKLSYVEDVTTIAVPDEIKENITISYIILKKNIDEEISTNRIKQDLKGIIVDYQIPEKIRFISRFPVNTSGKVCKKQLLEQDTK